MNNVGSVTYSDVLMMLKEADKEIAELKDTIEKAKHSFCGYVYSEGCDCCQGQDHDMYAEELGKVFNVKKYEDGTGYDFFEAHKEHKQ